MSKGRAVPLTPGAGQLPATGPMPTPHPAKFSPNVIAGMRAAIAGSGVRGNVLDPFGGVGGVHELAGPLVTTWCIELEPEWAIQAFEHGWMYAGDFFHFDPEHATFCRRDDSAGGTDIEVSPLKFDIIATSPTYGNRMADHHNAKDGSTRITYKHKLGRDLSHNNSGALQFGVEYKVFHLRAYKRFRQLLVPGGLVLLNVSDFQRKGVMLPASRWHMDAMHAVGFECVKTYNVPTPRMGYGKNGQARAEFEQLHVFRWPG